MDELKLSVACVLHANRDIAGTAFLVKRLDATKGLFLTCDHVVAAFSDAPEALTLRFVTGESCLATIAARAPEQDLALLCVETLLPPSAVVLPLGASTGSTGHTVASFGFPRATGLGGAFGKGSVLGELEINGVRSLQLADSDELTRGFSGAPAWDVTRARAIGVVRYVVKPDELGRLSNTSFVTTSDCVRRAFANLEVTDTCPFKGLRRFSQHDAALYRGRSRITQTLLHKLSAEPAFLLVLGPSGSGKSSLVRAGVLPRIAGGKMRNSARWDIAIVEPDAGRLVQEGGSPHAVAIVANRDVLASVAEWRAEHADALRLLIVIDQFERLFSEPFDQVRDRVLQNIMALSSSHEPVTIIAIMRSEFFGVMSEAAPAQLTAALNDHSLNIPRNITESELREIIADRTTESGWAIKEDLVDAIIDDAVGAKESKSVAEREAAVTILPLLEFCLWRLWQADDRSAEPGELTLARYRSNGRLYDSLADWGEQAYRGLTTKDQAVVRRVLTRLVHPGIREKNVPPTGQSHDLNALDADGPSGESVFEVIQYLTNHHLLVSTESNGKTWMRLAHESLITRWPSLRSWVDDDYDFQRWLNVIDESIAKARRAKPETSARLLQGDQLVEAERWFVTRSADFPEEVNTLIVRSLHKRRAQKFSRLTLASLAIVALLAVGLNQLQARREMRESALRSVAFGGSIATANANADTLRATALAIAGPEQFNARVGVDPVIQLYVRALNLELPRVITRFDQIFELSAPMGAPGLAVIGTRTGLAENERELAVWDGTGEEPRTVRGAFTGLAWSADRQLIVVGDVSSAPLRIQFFSQQLIPLLTVPVPNLKAPNRWSFGNERPEQDFYPFSVGELKFSTDRRRLFIAGLASHLQGINIPHHWRAWGELPSEVRKDARIAISGLVDYENELDIVNPNREFLVISPDEKTILSDGLGEVYADDLRTKSRSLIGNHRGGTKDIDVSPSGALVAGMGYDGLITVYRRPANVPGTWTTDTFSLPSGMQPTRIRFARELALVIALDDGRLVWLDLRPQEDLDRGRLNLDGIDVLTTPRLRFVDLDHTGPINALSISPGGRYVATAGQDGSIGLIDTFSFETRRLRCHERAVTLLAFQTDTRLVSSGLDGRICIWPLYERYWPSDPGGSPRNATVSDAMWDQRAGLTAFIVRQSLGFVHALRMSPDGRFVAGRTYDGKLTIWHAANGSVLKRLETDSNNGRSGFGFSGDSRYLVFEGQRSQLTNATSKTNAQRSYGFKLLDVTLGEEHDVETSVTPQDGLFSSDGKWASVDDATGLTLQNVADGIDGARLKQGRFSPSGRYFVTVSTSRVRIWDRRVPGRPFAEWSLSKDMADGVAANEDNADADNEDAVVLFARSEAFIVMAPTSRTTSSVAVLWLQAGKRVDLVGDGLQGAVAISADDRTIAVGGLYGTTYLFDAATGRESGRLGQHARFVTDVAFTPEGRYLVTASRDRTVRLWDTSGTLFARFEFKNPIEAIAVDPAGRRLFLAAGGGIHWLSLPGASTVAEARVELERLTNVRYVPKSDSLRFDSAGSSMVAPTEVDAQRASQATQAPPVR